MRVSLEWLSDFVDITGLTPEVIADALTGSGLEVESIERTGVEFSGVVVGKVEKIEPHPNANKLQLVNVNLGPLGRNRVVCGAKNVTEGMYIAYAQVGATVINRKEGGLFQLKPVTIRGIESTGMICSLEELGLEERFRMEGEGIWPISSYVLDDDLGKDIKEALNLKNDTILDVTPNANRGDLMSIIGVAREVSALFKRSLNIPVPKVEDLGQDSPFQVRLEDSSVCQYYAGAVLDNVKISESPGWMKERLINSGVRSINNVVDITNYVMLEFGQPLHAFDIYKLGSEGLIGVRHARSGETFYALDGITYSLAEQSVVVIFNDRPVALGGVMGGEETGISESTENLFLESAYFPPASNRRNARSVGIRTESSARFERGVDPVTTETAFYRAIELLKLYAGATLRSVAKDDKRQLGRVDSWVHEDADSRKEQPGVYTEINDAAEQRIDEEYAPQGPKCQHALKSPQISFSLDRMAETLGLSIPREDSEQILNSLGFSLEPENEQNRFKVSVPSFRSQDVYREIDLIEEVIRIYGYDNIPYTLPQETLAPVVSLRAKLLKQIRRILSASGLTEVATHSLIGETLLNRTGFSQDPKTTVYISNSRSLDHTFLRQSLIPNLIEIARFNQSQGNEDIWLFELGKTYFKLREHQKKDSGVEEPLYISGLLMNSHRGGIWHQQLETDFYTVKGVIENLFEQLALADRCKWSLNSSLTAMHPGQTASILFGDIEIGFIGKLHPKLQDDIKFKAPIYLFELNFEEIYKVILEQQRQFKVEVIPAFPSVKRDISFSALKTVRHQDIIMALKKANEPLLQNIELFDEYTGLPPSEPGKSHLLLQSIEESIKPQLKEGYRSLAYRLTLQSFNETLTDKEINTAMDKLKQQLASELSVSFR